MNEILMFFDLPSNTTIDYKDTKIITIRIIKYEHSSFTVIFAYIA